MRISTVSGLCLLAFQSIACAPVSGPSEDGGGGTTGTGATGSGATTGAGGEVGAGGVVGGGGIVGAGGTGSGGELGGTGATTGAGGTTNGTGVGCAGADIVCDDFEGGTLDLTKWRKVAATMGGMDPAIDSTKGHDSATSLRVEPAGGTGRFLTSAAAFPAGGELYVRAYMNFGSATKDMTGHGGFIVGATQDTNSNELRFGASKDGCNAPNFLLDLNHIPTDKTICSSGHITGGNPADAPDPDGITLEANTWYCVETYWDTNVGEFRLWIDDVEQTALHADADAWCPIGQTCASPPNPWPIDFTLVKFGVQNYNGTSGNIWYDDVAFATQRIGCN